MVSFFRVAALVMRKDLTVEVRSREIIYTTIFFAVSCVLVFAFTSASGMPKPSGR
jgi:ABC-type transport system involved in cytochrome c biogenesis permease component